MADQNARQYVIEQRGDEWCLLTEDGSKTLGCHPSKEAAEAQERAVQAQKHAQLAYSYAINAKHAEAAEEFRRALEHLKIGGDPAELVKVFAGFSEGMCEKWDMGEEGGTTACISDMGGKVDDPGAFCAALHQWCTGEWPAEKKAAVSPEQKAERATVAEFAQQLIKIIKDGLGARTYAHDGEECELENGDKGKMQDGKCVPLSEAEHYALKARAYAEMEDGAECELPDGSAGTVQDGKCVAKETTENLTLQGVELFQTGEHNGDKYTEADLDEMVAAFRDQGYVPPLKLGHDETPGKPAVGWVENVRRVGEKLVGDITHIPEEVYKLIKRRGYDRVSAEIYWNLKSGGRKFRRALKAVALLGADVPAVSSLTPLHKLFNNVQGEVHIYDGITRNDSQRNEGGSMADSDLKKQLDALMAQITALGTEIGKGSDGKGAGEATAKLNSLATEVKLLATRIESSDDTKQKLLSTEDALAQSQRRIEALESAARDDRNRRIVDEVKLPVFRPYIQAFLEAASREERTVKFTARGAQKAEDVSLERVVRDFISELNKASQGLFKEHSVNGARLRDGDEVDLEDKGAVAMAVDRKTREFMVKNPKANYREAVQAVLDAEPDLKAAYVS